MNEIQAPNPINNKKFSIFCAGTIENGASEDWQDKFINELKEFDINIFNPRRDDWDSSLENSIENEKFYEQVNWEMDALDTADLIIFYFVPNSKSPITLLELGMYSHQDNVLVCCPNGFWRKGNVEIVCERFNIPFYENFDDLVEDIKENLSEILKQF